MVSVRALSADVESLLVVVRRVWVGRRCWCQ